MIDVKVSIKAQKFKLTFSSKQLQASVGRKVAKVVKSGIRKGIQPDGVPLLKAKDGGSRGPLKRSGRLIKSIKFYKGKVVPDPRINPGGSSTINMAGLMGVQIYGRRTWKARGNGSGDVRHEPLKMTDGLRRVGKEAAQEAIDKQIKKGQAKIKGLTR